MAHFSTEYIDELLSRVDMMDVMKNMVYVLKRAVETTTIMLQISRGKTDFDNGRIKKIQTYKCEACKTGGNAIHFARCCRHDFTKLLKNLLI